VRFFCQIFYEKLAKFLPYSRQKFRQFFVKIWKKNRQNLPKNPGLMGYSFFFDRTFEKFKSHRKEH